MTETRNLSGFELQIYFILSSHYGQLDLVLRDTITAIREIGYGTTNLNYYRYEEAKDEMVSKV